MTAHRKLTGDLAVQVLAAVAAILAIADPAVARLLLTGLLAAAVAVAVLVIAAAVTVTYRQWRARRRRTRRPGYLLGGRR